MTTRERAKLVVQMREEATKLRSRPKGVEAAEVLLLRAERLRLDGFADVMLATEPKPVEPPREMKIATEFPERRPGLTPAEVESLEKNGD